MIKTIKITAPLDTDERLDAYVASVESSLTRSAVVRLIETDMIRVNGEKTQKDYKLRAGDTIEIIPPEPEPVAAQPQDIALAIIYEDRDIIVVNKPCGMVVHPGAGNPDGTLVNALLHHTKGALSDIGGQMRPGIVHRLDKYTGGLILAAKNNEAHIGLAAQLKRREIGKVYHAIAIGSPREDSGKIDAPLGRDVRERKRMAVVRDSTRKARDALTYWSVIERFSGFSYLRCDIVTGRTHQIRVHMASIGHPLMGDTVYGGGKTKFELQNKAYICGQCLFAKELELKHPRTGEKMNFLAELPQDMSILLDKLRKLN